MPGNKKLTRLAFILLPLLLICFESFSQTTRSKFNRDSSQRISLTEFNQRVDRAVNLLQTKRLAEISDTDHINIMMCFNTIFMTPAKDNGPKIAELKNGDATLIMYAGKQRFSGGRYEQLLNLIENGEYFQDIEKVYPESRPNRGMGTFFPKLQMEIGGTPEAYALFTVSE